MNYQHNNDYNVTTKEDEFYNKIFNAMSHIADETRKHAKHTTRDILIRDEYLSEYDRF